MLKLDLMVDNYMKQNLNYHSKLPLLSDHVDHMVWESGLGFIVDDSPSLTKWL